MTRTDLIACPECDLLQRALPVPIKGTLRCCRCDAELARNHPDGLEQALALALGALVLLGISNLYPIVGLSVSGTLVQTTLAGAVRVLFHGGMWPLAILVLITTIVMPVLQTVGMLWVLLPLRLGRKPWFAPQVLRLCHQAESWGMTEVLILGLLVALVKLAHIASVVPGVALWSFGALMLVLVGAHTAFDPHSLWVRFSDVRTTSGARPHLEPPIVSGPITAAHCGLLSCHDCGLLTSAHTRDHALACPRCGATLHSRKPASLTRTWALLISAVVLYIPANVLPVMYTSSLFGAENDTILSGVAYLWTSGSWLLAIVVFIASIAVPMLKILALGYLAFSTQFHSTSAPKRRTKIYRVVEFVGRWSMLDIYVITVLVALVQFKALATIQAGPAAIAFGAVVVLTMFAAMTFDPRLIWDEAEHQP
ncbi:paraquat-inducible protein A [Cupriavidus metallidurans]|jgi:paraquat-inducible protein A|uniref:Paraquat-inducible protein A n=1 Tax=Cupriavidus metallidurans (strain ATCC 43123 / DSM 2839 / NBRC 102507 / CH34) TaxID=266264 RepID=Q1LFX0_CUPMC|nr:paraquat-inducible protein A [Cupriavidus metallidurans]ABF10956.1 paraquat-inducible protein A [Cupriavidus metallidurans CH34]AVA34876.1 paraquat-inducible protein A [Cupriavidus metallidurans]KWW39564.1 Paraquat-inducible protein A [Cupriavidus metallidurans]MDE4920781.1 paraquat-inducible protein A [Cupriavidus metallidurans]QGS32922.1 PqiA/YebS family transporter subunit [Cupriavidus metallidurans]